MKKAFTIVELMMVVAIIGILLGIVTTAASSSIKQAREHKANTCCKIVEQGFATYYAQKGEWPSVGKTVKSNPNSLGKDYKGDNGKDDPDRRELSATEIDSMIRELIAETKKNNPMMDISGLFVSRSSGEGNSKAYGMDFMDAIRGTKRSKKKMSVAEMHFGYPNSDGYFRRFRVVYSIPTDEMKVMR